MAEGSLEDLVNVDQFPCGCLVTTLDRKVLFVNQYFHEFLHWDLASRIGKSIDLAFGRASQLFCDSYVIPTTIHAGRCNEILLYVLNAEGVPIPMLANVRRTRNDTLTWVFIEAFNRNQLFHQLETARLALEEKREELERMSRTDPMTGVANRREMDAVLARMLKEADRSGLPVSVLVMDIDRFKTINDTMGHDAGDQAICAFAQTLLAVCRETDLVARLGGDEFVCILHDTDPEEAKVLAERIRAAVEGATNSPCPHTVSIGVSARTNRAAATAVTILKLADEALYVAKAEGRNRISVRLPVATD